MLSSRSGILADAISIFEISGWTENSDFIDKIFLKKVFPVKNRKSEHLHRILYIGISAGTKFQLKLTFLILRTKFVLKVYFRSKNKKVNNIIELCIVELD